MGWWFRIDLWKRVMLGLVIGGGIGLALRAGMGPEAGDAFATTWFKPWGDAFIALIRMLVVPLIFTTLVAGVLAMGDPKKLGSLGGRAIFLYMLTTWIAVSIGLGIGTLIQPGAGFDTSNVSAEDMAQFADKLGTNEEAAGLAERLIAIIPTNPLEAMVKTDVLAIIFFAILFGVGVLLAKEAGRPVGDAISSAAEAVMKMTLMIMETAPFGVLALMAWVMADQGFQVLYALGKMTAALYIACLIHMVITYGGLVKFVARLPILPFFRGITDAQAVAFSTASSNATLPVTIACATNNLGIRKPVASSVLPLGATVNMDGTALYQGLIALFAAQALGIEMSLTDYAMVALMATLVSIGTAGIPSVSLFLAATTLSVIGVTGENVVLIIAILFPFDRILDMARTVTNITGDAAVATVVAKWEGEINEAVYRAEDRV